MSYIDEQSSPLLSNSASSKDRTSKRKSTLLTVCPFILGNEFCERLAYYGLATNFVTYLTHIMGVDAATAAIEVMVFEGTCYITPILGAYLADSHWGRYKTILVFSSIYLVGMICLTLTSWIPGLTPGPTEDATLLQNGLLFTALGVIALGTGGIKPNVSAFGADQFDEKNPQDKREKESFFNWFYLAINIGSLIACTAIVYIQDSISWTVGFAVPAAAMATAVVLFLAGSGRYRHVAPTESPMARVVKVVAAALKNRWNSRKHKGSGAYRNLDVYDPAARDDDLDQSYRSFMRSDSPLTYYRGLSNSNGQQQQQQLPPVVSRYSSSGSNQSGAAVVGGYPISPSIARRGRGGSSSYRWLEDAITEWQTSQSRLMLPGGSAAAAATGPAAASGRLGGYTSQQVEEVKMVLRLLPVFFTTALYWTIYAMMGTMFIQQGALMDNRVVLPGGGSSSSSGGGGFVLRIPAATMALFNTGAIILLVPLYDTLFEPMLKKTGTKWTLLRRIGWGMFIAVLAMVYAAAIETWRLDIYQNMPDSEGEDGIISGSSSSSSVGEYGPTVVPLSIMWQAPAYILIGASEVFASIAQLEFFYDQAPDVMRSCSMALQLLSTAVGSYLGGGLVAAVAALTGAAGCPWLPKDLNTGHLDYFLLLCGGLMAVNTLLFLLVANNYEYKDVEHVVLVQVPDEVDQLLPPVGSQLTAGLPPRPPPGPSRGQGTAIAINATAARRSQYHYAAAAQDEEGELYSRSLAFVPTSPALPAPFR